MVQSCVCISGRCKYVADGDVLQDTNMLRDSQNLDSQRAAVPRPIREALISGNVLSALYAMVENVMGDS